MLAYLPQEKGNHFQPHLSVPENLQFTEIYMRKQISLGIQGFRSGGGDRRRVFNLLTKDTGKTKPARKFIPGRLEFNTLTDRTEFVSTGHQDRKRPGQGDTTPCSGDSDGTPLDTRGTGSAAATFLPEGTRTAYKCRLQAYPGGGRGKRRGSCSGKRIRQPGAGAKQGGREIPPAEKGSTR